MLAVQNNLYKNIRVKSLTSVKECGDDEQKTNQGRSIKEEKQKSKEWVAVVENSPSSSLELQTD